MQKNTHFENPKLKNTASCPNPSPMEKGTPPPHTLPSYFHSQPQTTEVLMGCPPNEGWPDTRYPG